MLFELGVLEILIVVGCIINVASLLGSKGGRGSAGYAASKAGVIGEFAAWMGGKRGNADKRRFHACFSSRSRQIIYPGECHRARLH